jgi:hypothetical protein
MSTLKAMNFDFLQNLQQGAAHTWNDSFLVITATSSVAVTVTFSWETYVRDGEIPVPGITKGQSIIAVPGTLVPTSVSIPLREGFLYALKVSAPVTLGQTYINASINMGSVAGVYGSQELIGGYVTSQTALTFPGSGVVIPTQGTGRIYSFGVGNPAAGNDWTATVPSLVRWQVLGVTGTLTTGAAAANRYISLQYIVLGAGNSLVSSLSVAIPANMVANMVNAPTYLQNMSYAPMAGSTLVFLTMPSPLWLVGTGSIQSVTGNIQGTDQWSNIGVIVEEWINL